MTKIGPNFITVSGKRVGVRYSIGPWAAHVDPTTIKIRPKSRWFPDEFKAVFPIENNSDILTDYFELDCIRVVSTHPLYSQIHAVANK